MYMYHSLYVYAAVKINEWYFADAYKFYKIFVFKIHCRLLFCHFLRQIIIAAGVDWRFNIKPAIIKYYAKNSMVLKCHMYVCTCGSFQS